VDLAIFEDKKGVQKRSVYNMEFIIIFARISAQLWRRRSYKTQLQLPRIWHIYLHYFRSPYGGKDLETSTSYPAE
jgi:hypothetical protein